MVFSSRKGYVEWSPCGLKIGPFYLLQLNAVLDVPQYDPTIVRDGSYHIAMNVESGCQVPKFEILVGVEPIVWSRYLARRGEI